MARPDVDFEQATGRLVLRCDAEMFEWLQAVVCHESGVFVPISVPVTPVREVAIVLAANAPRPRISCWRHLVALLICLFLATGPFGLYAMIAWSLK